MSYSNIFGKFTFFNILFSAILVTGGNSEYDQPSPRYKSVEVLRANGTYWCSLPDLPDGRMRHTLSGTFLCGSAFSESRDSCLSLGPDNRFTKKINLSEIREGHSSWQNSKRILLMGGTDRATDLEQNSTEIVTSDGAFKSFSLQYNTA